MSLLDKPLSDIKRRRRADGYSRHGLHGHTGRRRRDYDIPQMELNAGGYCSRLARPGRDSILWTALEVEGRLVSHSLNRDLAWEHIPALLAENAVGKPEVRQNSDGTVSTTFRLEPIVEEVPCKEPEQDIQPKSAKRSHINTDGKIYVLRPHLKRRPQLFAVLPTDAPECVHAKLLSPARMGGLRALQCPLVRRAHGAFDCTRHGGIGSKYCKLEIDLGEECEISNISSQGRQPPTRRYPQVKREKRRMLADARGRRYNSLMGIGRRATRTEKAGRREADAEGPPDSVYSVEGLGWWDLVKHGEYVGPFYDIVDLHPDEERTRYGRPYQPHERWLQWVSRYAVYYRTDGGRQWHSLGIFAGNADAITEVAHDVRGLVARYLRIVPLQGEGGGAMRFGVYGKTAAKAAATAGGAEQGGEDAPEPIAYTLQEVPETVNMKYTSRGWYGRDRYHWYGREKKSRKRHNRRMDAAREGTECVWED